MGSVALHDNQSGKENCGCHADPRPSFQWMAKASGNMVNRQLSPGEATLYNEWSGNDRRVRGLLVQMREVSVKAQQLMFKEIPAEPA